MIDRQIFSSRLRALRTKRGLSQPQLAKELGMIKQRVNNWESGLSLPSADVLVALSDYFGVSVDYLVGRSEKPTRR